MKCEKHEKNTIQLKFMVHLYMGQRRYTGCVAQPVHCDAKLKKKITPIINITHQLFVL
jgi:hypothetical protein